MNRIHTLPFLLTLALPLAAQDGTHDLKLAVTKGASVWYTQHTSQSQEIDMGGQIMESSNHVHFAVQLTVKDIDADGLVSVDAKIARVSGQFALPQMGEFPFDSIDNKAEGADAEKEDADEFGMPDFDAIAKAAASFAGSTFQAKIDAHGAVKSLEGVDAAIATLNKKAGQMGAQMLGPHFSKSGMESLIRSAFGERPSKPMSVGGTWERAEKKDSSGPATATKITMTLLKVTDKAFEITGAGTIEKPEADAAKKVDAGEDDETAAMMREMQDKMKISNGKVSGRTLVSREDGFVVDSKTEMVMDLTVPGPFGEMSIKQKSSVTTKRTTAEAAMAKADKAADDKSADKGADKGADK